MMKWTTFFILCQLFAHDQNDPEEKIIVVDDFNMCELNKMPKDWNGRSEEAYHEYKISQDSTGKFLTVYSEDSDMFIIKQIEVNIVEYPYLNWRWKVEQYDTTADESVKEFCDNPASIAVVFRLSKLIPKSIKYTWSASLPVNTFTSSPYAIWPSRTDIIVLESGDRNKGQWMNVKRNVLRDYLALHKRASVGTKEIKAIVIMSDSDNTNSTTIASYDDIYFSKQ